MDAPTVGAVLGGTFLCAASANSFNQILEVPYDARMARTSKRPLPSGRISPAHATSWASAAGLTGIGTLALGTNPVTAALGGGTLALYTLVYTPMKRTTPLNTWVGSVVGALPPLMGWTAGGGSLLSPEAALLFSSLFLWQMPHFLSLAWLYRQDYAQGGYNMLSRDDPCGERTAGACLEYSLYLGLLPPAAWAAGLTSCMFPLEGLVLNGLFIGAAWRFRAHEKRGHAHARRLFLASLLYLPVFFACLLLHQRRETAALETALEEDKRGAIEHVRGEVRARGRELCLHEQMLTAPHAEDAGAASTAPPLTATAANPGRCPVVFADTVVSGARALSSQQPQQRTGQQ